ncbi:hypothetical protein [Niallia sp. MER TA 168]|uniref:hypothetical protein n=1 Tax=Niallia sp. MER TA 168 TaxID=2939568 RepID=UPI00203D4948|nr:hypothetical protein [Niallia sp. MER TA 168]MCM3363448.1 hypothetical protein [Niallia sp. MER TA 168]
MMISNSKIAETIAQITTISGIQHVPTDVITDVINLANAFPNDFDSAADNVIRSIIQIKRNPHIGGLLRDNYVGYRSFHYQNKRVNKHPADMRTIYRYREDNGVIYLHGFGRRHNSDSVYKRFQGR